MFQFSTVAKLKEPFFIVVPLLTLSCKLYKKNHHILEPKNDAKGPWRISLWANFRFSSQRKIIFQHSSYKLPTAMGDVHLIEK